MKVTREIKNHLVRKVNEVAAKLPRPAKDKLDAANEEERKVHEEIDKIAEKANDAALALLRKHPNLAHDEYYKKLISFNESSVKVRKSIVDKAYKERDSIEDKARARVDELFTELTLAKGVDEGNKVFRKFGDKF